MTFGCLKKKIHSCNHLQCGYAYQLDVVDCNYTGEFLVHTGSKL